MKQESSSTLIFPYQVSNRKAHATCIPLYPLFSPGSPSVSHYCLFLFFARSREFNHMQMPLQKKHFIPGQSPTHFLISMGLKNSQGGFCVLIQGLSPRKKWDSIELNSPLLKHIYWEFVGELRITIYFDILSELLLKTPLSMPIKQTTWRLQGPTNMYLFSKTSILLYITRNSQLIF